MMAARPNLYAWTPSSVPKFRASLVYHRIVDAVITPRGPRYVMACGAHLSRVRIAIGHRGMPSYVQRSRKVCAGCRTDKDRG